MGCTNALFGLMKSGDCSPESNLTVTKDLLNKNVSKTMNEMESSMTTNITQVNNATVKFGSKAVLKNCKAEIKLDNTGTVNIINELKESQTKSVANQIQNDLASTLKNSLSSEVGFMGNESTAKMNTNTSTVIKNIVSNEFISKTSNEVFNSMTQVNNGIVEVNGTFIFDSGINPLPVCFELSMKNQLEFAASNIVDKTISELQSNTTFNKINETIDQSMTLKAAGIDSLISAALLPLLVMMLCYTAIAIAALKYGIGGSGEGGLEGNSVAKKIVGIVFVLILIVGGEYAYTKISSAKKEMSDITVPSADEQEKKIMIYKGNGITKLFVSLYTNGLNNKSTMVDTSFIIDDGYYTTDENDVKQTLQLYVDKKNDDLEQIFETFGEIQTAADIDNALMKLTTDVGILEETIKKQEQKISYISSEVEIKSYKTNINIINEKKLNINYLVDIIVFSELLIIENTPEFKSDIITNKKPSDLSKSNIINFDPIPAGNLSLGNFGDINGLQSTDEYITLLADHCSKACLENDECNAMYIEKYSCLDKSDECEAEEEVNKMTTCYLVRNVDELDEASNGIHKILTKK